MTEPQLTVAILAGGDSTRFTTDKALAQFRGRPLLQHMLAIAHQVSSNVIVVVSSEDQADRFRPLVGSVKIVSDPEGTEKCALTGALTAFEYVGSPFTLLLPVDTPLANVPLLKALYDLRGTHSAIVPSWPEGYVEPLHAVYRTETAYARGLGIFEQGDRKMQALLDVLPNVLYISTLVLKEFDPDLRTFANINTEQDLRRLERHRGRAS
ncbi:MAG: molybdenum cofactor guanylyltransferase [Candidatus Thorarchaeota archaeon]|nr:molybdenum cofactor guanylyltransferase [Candidatus Thorarchaeota archaeon]